MRVVVGLRRFHKLQRICCVGTLGHAHNEKFGVAMLSLSLSLFSLSSLIYMCVRVCVVCACMLAHVRTCAACARVWFCAAL